MPTYTVSTLIREDVAVPVRPCLQAPEAVNRFMRERVPNIEEMPQETMYSISLDTRARVLSLETVTVGLLNMTAAPAREVFRAAISHSAASVILCHNHPSGDPKPSADDIRTTKQLAAVGTILGIEVLDHVIIGGPNYRSLRETGAMS